MGRRRTNNRLAAAKTMTAATIFRASAERTRTAKVNSEVTSVVAWRAPRLACMI
jgi:hypothetical protein